MERPQVPVPRRSPSSAVAVWVALVAFLLSAVGGTPGGQQRRARSPTAKVMLRNPVAPRADLRVPGFSHPTSITNPLFPVSQLTQVLQLGAEGGERVRFEMTLLPGTTNIQWEGRSMPTVATQLVAYNDGRVAEVATDFYAQADDAGVWHFG
ncbi:MAG: hypothetical protein WKF86_02385, partial [Acidimicrobiales bacterium]